MNKETIMACIELVNNKYTEHYEKAKIIGINDPVKEAQYVRASIALKSAEDALWDLLWQCPSI